MGADTAFQLQVKAVVETNMKSRRSQKLVALFAATDEALLRKASTKQIQKILSAIMAVQTCAAGVTRVL